MSLITAFPGTKARQRYGSENRRLLHKRARVFKSSRGKWQYEALVTHGQRMQRLAEERKREKKRAEELAEAEARQKLRQLAQERKRARELAEAQADQKAGSPAPSHRKVA